MWTLFVFFFGISTDSGVAVSKLENIESQSRCLAIKAELHREVDYYYGKRVIITCTQTKDKVKS